MIEFPNNKKIVLDADVIIHFWKGGKLSLLPLIYKKNRYILLKQVYKEISNGKLKNDLITILNWKKIEEFDISTNMDVLKEFAFLKKRFGIGESACMAYCKYNKDVLASSNLKDIKTYCKNNKIQYLTTMDFINSAYEQKMLDEAECDYFIYNVKSKGSILPCNKIKEYRNLKGL